MLSHLNNYHIILASQSPRRQEMLSKLNIPFEVQAIEVEETYPNQLVGVDIPMYLAEKKANEFNYNGIKADTKIPMGIFYAKERPTIEEQYEVLRKKIRK